MIATAIVTDPRMIPASAIPLTFGLDVPALIFLNAITPITSAAMPNTKFNGIIQSNAQEQNTPTIESQLNKLYSFCYNIK